MSSWTPLWAITISSLKMLLRNKQTMFFTWVFPLALMLVIGFLTETSGGATFSVGVAIQPQDDGTSQQLQTTLESIEAFEITTGTLEEELEALRSDDRVLVVDASTLLSPKKIVDGDDAMTVAPSSSLTVYQSVSRQLEAGTAMLILQQVLLAGQLAESGQQPAVQLDVQQVESQDIRYVDFLVPGIIAMTIMQLGIFGTSFSLVSDREKGIMRRIMATPTRAWQYVTGNMLARLVISFLQTAILIAVATLAFDVQFQQWGILLLLSVGGNIIFLSLGLVVAGLSKTTESVPLIGNLLVFPMLLVGGIFFSTDMFPDWLKLIVDQLPVAPLADLLRNTVTVEQTFGEQGWRWLVFAVWMLVAPFLATRFFRMQERD